MKNHICATSVSGVSGCNRDSGDGLITSGAQPTIIGVYSWRADPCALPLPDIYARVSSHLAFIRAAVM